MMTKIFFDLESKNTYIEVKNQKTFKNFIICEKDEEVDFFRASKRRNRYKKQTAKIKRKYVGEDSGESNLIKIHKNLYKLNNKDNIIFRIVYFDEIHEYTNLKPFDIQKSPSVYKKYSNVFKKDIYLNQFLVFNCYKIEEGNKLPKLYDIQVHNLTPNSDMISSLIFDPRFENSFGEMKKKSDDIKSFMAEYMYQVTNSNV